MSAARDDDLDHLRAGLVARSEDLAVALLGQPSSRAGRQLRWGKNLAVALDVRGAKRGLWIDHRDGQGGDLLSLIRRERGGSFPDTVAFARTFLQLPTVEAPSRPSALPDRTDGDRSAWAQRLAEDCVPIEGTVAEQYLVETRGIPKPAAGWPEAVRFHRGRRALVVIATTTAGTVQAVQLVYLGQDARKLSPEEAKRREVPVKQTFGLLAGAAVRLPGDAASPVLVAEGPESGLSVWAASGHETWISLGTSNVAKLPPPTDRAVVICRDDDRQWSPADRALRKAVHSWREAGTTVHVASPWPERRQDKSDFNDALQICGTVAVAARIAVALQPASGARFRQSQQAARALLKSAIAEFEAATTTFDRGGDETPPVHALRVDLGIGKSHGARDMLARRLAAMRAAGDKRTVVIAIPTHRLGEDQAAAFMALPLARAAGLTAAVWRSREAFDPNFPDQRMCQNLEPVRDARAAGADVQRAACQREMPDGTLISCPFFGGCAFQAQRHQTADLWFVAHEMLFTAKPAAIGNPALVVVDETPWHAAMRLDPTGRPFSLSLDALGSQDQRPGDLSNPNWVTLQHHRGRAVDALHGLTDGPLPAEALHAFGLTAADAGEAIVLEWTRKISVDMHPGMSSAARKAAVVAAEANKTVARLAMFWAAVRELLRDGGAQESGWAALATEATDHGPVRVLQLKGRKPVREGWQVPTLLMDATMQIDLLRPIWPQLVLTADVAATTPHQTVRQVADLSFSKHRLAPAPDGTPADQRRRGKNLRELHAILGDFTRRHAPGRVLGVLQKAIEEALPSVGPLPGGLELGHHNAVAGRDEWGPGDDRPGISGLVVVGRTSPPPADVERMAECLTGRAVTPLASWYPRLAVAREMADGTTTSAEADRHPDPVAEAIRWRICEGELVQIIGRARGVNRTEADPVEILVMTDAPLPLPIDAVLAASDLAPGPIELMLAAGGVALDCAADAARAYPTLWPARDGSGGSAEAARKAFRRGSAGQIGIEDSLYGIVPHFGLRRATYRLAGQGRETASLTFDPMLVPDPSAWLAERVGALAMFEVLGMASSTRSSVRPPRERPTASPPAALGPPPLPLPPEPSPVATPKAPSMPVPPPYPAELRPAAANPASVEQPVGAPSSPAARLATLSTRLDALRPPPLQGDGSDTVRLLAWRSSRLVSAEAARAGQRAA